MIHGMRQEALGQTSAISLQRDTELKGDGLCQMGVRIQDERGDKSLDGARRTHACKVNPKAGVDQPGHHFLQRASSSPSVLRSRAWAASKPFSSTPHSPVINFWAS